MESDKAMFIFFNKFISLDPSEGGVDVNVNIRRKYIINRFHKTVPSSRILITLTLIDGVILKLHKKNLDKKTR